MARLISPANPFAGVQVDFNQAKYVIFGFPYDLTSTYRFGSRHAPNAIREASLNIETYSVRAGLYVEQLAIHDLGDLEVSGVADPFQELEALFSRVYEAGKLPVVLGGEHTLTYSTAGSLSSDIALLIFDAHLDLRDSYEGRRFSHTTYLRRLIERRGNRGIFLLGVRAISREEAEYAEKSGIEYFSALEVSRKSLEEVFDRVVRCLKGFTKLYVSLDMDVFDPAYAPAASNPEPEGLTPTQVLDFFEALTSKFNLVGLDVVEFSPLYDNGVTAILASKLLFEFLCLIESRRGK
ncbi:MAG: agmatinase [Candidatus Hecatellaceae archaeon]